MPVEYGGTSTVPVSESPEERNLRRLVEAINANASANADASRNDNTSAARGVSPSRSQTTDWKTSPARSVYRSPPRNVGGAGGGVLIVYFDPWTAAASVIPHEDRSTMSPQRGFGSVEVLTLELLGGEPQFNSEEFVFEKLGAGLKGLRRCGSRCGLFCTDACYDSYHRASTFLAIFFSG